MRFLFLICFNTLGLFGSFFSIAACYAQLPCQQIRIYAVNTEGQPYLDSETVSCVDSQGRLVEYREFGQGRELQYFKREYDERSGYLMKESYRHGYESFDGGEGTYSYVYAEMPLKRMKEVICTAKTAHFKRITNSLTQLNEKGLITSITIDESTESEVMEDMNYKRKTSIVRIYDERDSMISEIIREPESEIIHKKEFNQKGQITLYEYVEREIPSGNMTSAYRILYSYNQQGLLLELKQLILPNEEPFSTTTNTYEKGLLTQEKYLSYLNGKVDETRITNNSYDNNKRLTQTKMVSTIKNKQDGQLSVQTTTTMYEAEGRTTIDMTQQLNGKVHTRNQEVYQDDVLQSSVYEYEGSRTVSNYTQEKKVLATMPPLPEE